MSEETILIVDDEPTLRRSLEKMLLRAGYAVHTASDPEQGQQLLESTQIDLAILDLQMPDWTGQISKTAGIDLLRKAREIQPEIVVIMLTAHATVETAVDALKLGAFDFIIKGQAEPTEFLAKVREGLDTRGGEQVSDAGLAPGRVAEDGDPAQGIWGWLKERVPGVTDEILASLLLSALLFIFGKLIGVLEGGFRSWFKSVPSFLYLTIGVALVIVLVGVYVYWQKRR